MMLCRLLKRSSSEVSHGKEESVERHAGSQDAGTSGRHQGRAGEDGSPVRIAAQGDCGSGRQGEGCQEVNRSRLARASAGAAQSGGRQHFSQRRIDQRNNNGSASYLSVRTETTMLENRPCRSYSTSLTTR